MQISKNTVVQFHYRLSDEQGQIENSREHQPVLYLHGHPGLIDGLSNALEGHQACDSFSITLSPEQAYGERRENAIQRVPVKHLQGARKWQPGMTAVVETENGAVQVTVSKVGLKMADIDTNHPLAGKTLTFDIDILDVRAASEEEIAHGHAHGVGGHQH